MQIQSTQNLSYNRVNSRPVFKASSPVMHWVAEVNGGYSPVATAELTKKLQRKIVSLLNGTKKNLSDFEKQVKDYIARCDIDYRRDAVVRSYYDKKAGWDGKIFEPISYLLTGRDAIEFDKTFGQAIGIAVKDAPRKNGHAASAEVAIAKGDYVHNGKNFVKSKSRRLYDSNGISHSLHTKFQIKRSKTGRIKDYELVGVKFCPDEGSKNPFVVMGYVK